MVAKPELPQQAAALESPAETDGNGNGNGNGHGDGDGNGNKSE
jgi:hypothetical protein